MPFDDAGHSFLGIPFEGLRAPRRATKKRRARRTPKRTVDYAARSTAATLRKQEAIRTFLELAGEGATVTQVGEALGISRQLALYHVKKMAATSQLVMILEPCLENGGLQFKVWKEETLVNYFGRFSAQMRRARAFRQEIAA